MSQFAIDRPLKNYKPVPYACEGGFSLGGLFITMVAGMLVAIVTGVLAAVIGQFFYAVLIFPVLMGGAVGAVQAFAIRNARIRTPWACGVAGLVAGFIGVATVHYVDYQVFRWALVENSNDNQGLKWALAETEDAEQRAMLQQMVADLRREADVAGVHSTAAFLCYIDWAAKLGVELTFSRGNSTGMNLGYVGSYAYWGLEALLVAAISAFMARTRACEPFCTVCDRWNERRELGTLQVKPRAAADVVESGRLTELSLIPVSAKEQAAISVYECPSCSNEAGVVIQVDSVTYKGGSREKSEIIRAVYPSDAANDLIYHLYSPDARSETGSSASKGVQARAGDKPPANEIGNLAALGKPASQRF